MSETRGSRPIRTWWQRPGCVLPPIVILLLVIIGVVIYLNVYQGRDIARITGRPVEVMLPECVTTPDQIISISFHTKAAGETVKDVTYVCDGRIFSREYNDFGILQGTIEWIYERPSGATP